MPTVFTHAVAAGALAYAAPGASERRLLVAVAAVSAVVPDLDVVAFEFGVPYGHVFGHRGFSHSLLFAALWATAVAAWWSRAQRGTQARPDGRWRLWGVIACAMASHGLLDAMTNGGRGVGFWAPVLADRYFFAWRPLAVSPIGGGFFSARSLDGTFRWVGVATSELLWVWLPSALLVGAVATARRFSRRAVQSPPLAPPGGWGRG